MMVTTTTTNVHHVPPLIHTTGGETNARVETLILPTESLTTQAVIEEGNTGVETPELPPLSPTMQATTATTRRRTEIPHILAARRRRNAPTALEAVRGNDVIPTPLATHRGYKAPITLRTVVGEATKPTHQSHPHSLRKVNGHPDHIPPLRSGRPTIAFSQLPATTASEDGDLPNTVDQVATVEPRGVPAKHPHRRRLHIPTTTNRRTIPASRSR